MSKNHTAAAGFSLVELLLVLAVSMIVMGFAVPVVQNAIRAYTVNSAASNVSRFVQLARYAAIRRNAPACTLIQGRFFGVDTDCDGAFASSDSRYTLPAGIVVHATGPGTVDGMNFSDTPVPADPSYPAPVTFNARGNTALSPAVGVIYLEGWGNYSAVTVTGVGRARSWRYNGSTWY
jgi:type II secretory pathway pseudopilin PulG